MWLHLCRSTSPAHLAVAETVWKNRIRKHIFAHKTIGTHVVLSTQIDRRRERVQRITCASMICTETHRDDILDLLYKVFDYKACCAVARQSIDDEIHGNPWISEGLLSGVIDLD